MKCQNTATKHSRLLEFSEIPPFGDLKRLPDRITVGLELLESNCSNAIVLDNVILPAIINAINTPVSTAVKLNAGNDRNGNPRRLYLVTTKHQSGHATVKAIDEEYLGIAALHNQFPNCEVVADIDTTPTEYKRLLRRHG